MGIYWGRGDSSENRLGSVLPSGGPTGLCPLVQNPTSVDSPKTLLSSLSLSSLSKFPYDENTIQPWRCETSSYLRKMVLMRRPKASSLSQNRPGPPLPHNIDMWGQPLHEKSIPSIGIYKQKAKSMAIVRGQYNSHFHTRKKIVQQLISVNDSFTLNIFICFLLF